MAAKNTTVLLVEDNEDNLLIYSTILRHSGYAVVEARDGQAGIDAAKKEHPGLILMDVSIPVIDGLEATRRLKADPDTRDIPIIALTAHALASDQQKAIEAGCDSYIAKPAEPRAVVAAVREYLGEPARRPEPLAQVTTSVGARLASTCFVCPQPASPASRRTCAAQPFSRSPVKSVR